MLSTLCALQQILGCMSSSGLAHTFAANGTWVACHGGLLQHGYVGVDMCGFCVYSTAHLQSQVDGGRQMEIRSADPRYMQHVERFWGTLLPLLQPYFYSQGGPILMLQVCAHCGGLDINRCGALCNTSKLSILALIQSPHLVVHSLYTLPTSIQHPVIMFLYPYSCTPPHHTAMFPDGK